MKRNTTTKYYLLRIRLEKTKQQNLVLTVLARFLVFLGLLVSHILNWD